MRRWEYLQEAFATETPYPYPENAHILLFPWGKDGPFPSEQAWLNAKGAEGWELVAVEAHALPARVFYPYVPSGYTGNLADIYTSGSIAAKRWTFRREVAD